MYRQIAALFVCLIAFWGRAADYESLHNTLIDFYAYQRAGLKDADPYNPFYSHSPYPHANDNYNGNRLDGGWYDAGDFVKFGLNLGFTVYCLLKGYDVFPACYDDRHGVNHETGPDGIPDILNEARFAVDYLIKAVVSDNAVVMDVGNAYADHRTWASGYHASGDRAVLMATGADAPGLYAAALAIMSRLYARYDETYAATCLEKARQAFAFCTGHKRVSNQQGNGEFYDTDAWRDKMACGAVELYRATGEETYLTWAKELLPHVGQHYDAIGYRHAGDFAAFELARLGEEGFTSAWLGDVNQAINRVVPMAAENELIRGAFINTSWGTCGNAGNAAFSAALAYMITGKNEYRDFVMQQINWIAGFSPFSRSFVSHYNGGPAVYHHRNGMNIQNVKLRGAIVSGPSVPGQGIDPNNPDSYSWIYNPYDQNHSSNYYYLEPAINYNAGAIGAIAFIRTYRNPPAELIRIEEGLQASPDRVDFNSGPTTITMTMERSAHWTIVLTGRTSGARKTLSGSGAAVSVSWAGDADAGSVEFTGGEIVDLVFEHDYIAEYHQNRARAVLTIASTEDQPFTDRDVLLDAFDDGDWTNAVGGRWEPFSDSSEAGAGAASSAPVIYSVPAKDDSKGLMFRPITATGADHPYAGVKATFNTQGSPVAIGPAKSAVFDINASSENAAIRIELEQPEIGEKCYYGKTIQVPGAAWYRIRVPFNQCTQPEWATQTMPLNLSAISSIRFTYYGSGSGPRFTLDNVHIEDLVIGAAVVAVNPASARRGALRPVVRGSGLWISLPVAGGALTTRIVTPGGRQVFAYDHKPHASGARVRMNNVKLAPGAYLISTWSASGMLQAERLYRQ